MGVKLKKPEKDIIVLTTDSDDEINGAENRR